MALRHVGQHSWCKNGQQKAEWLRIADNGRTIQAASNPNFTDASNRATNLKYTLYDLAEIEGRIWAQSDGMVCYSDDDGTNWNSVNTWKSLDQLNYNHVSGYNALLPEKEDKPQPEPVSYSQPKTEKVKAPKEKKKLTLWGIIWWIIKLPFRLIWWILKFIWRMF